ncbi:micronuclear linker histone polyprotein [Anabrus simplex]|uniref:micronuclear linker histone polyprotein n=1 Tax=Anabrus simplex TaxID=316456 RepID=UPI0035A366C5
MMRKATENRGLPPSRPYHYRILGRNDEMLDTRSMTLGTDTENYRNAPPEYASRRAPQYQRALQQHYRDRRTRSQYGGRKVVREQTSRAQGSGQQYNNQRYRRPQQGYKLNKQKGAKHKMDVAQQAVSQEKEVDEQISVTQVVVVEETINVSKIEEKTPVKASKIEEKTPVKARASPRKSESRSPEKKSVSPSKKSKSPEKKVQKKSPRMKPETKTVEKSNSVPDVVENGSGEASTSKDDDDNDDDAAATTLGNRSLRIRLSDIALKDSSYTKTVSAPEEPKEDSDILHVSNSSLGSLESSPAGKNVSKKSGKFTAEELSSNTSSKPMDKSPQRERSFQQEKPADEHPRGERSYQQEKPADESPRGERSFQRESSLGRSLRSISARRPIRGSNSFVSPSTSSNSFSALSSPQFPVLDSPKNHSDKKAKSPEKLKEMESEKLCETEMLNMSTEDVTANTSCVIIAETGIDGSSKKRKSRTSETEQELKKLKAQDSEEVSTPSRSSFLSLVSSPFFLFKRAKTEEKENSTISHEPVDENLEIAGSPLETLSEKLAKEDCEVEVVELDENITSDTLDKEIPSEVVADEVSGYRKWCSIM